VFIILRLWQGSQIVAVAMVYSKKIKEKLIQRINQVEKELTNKLDILVQENTKFEEDEISKVFEITDEVELYLRHMIYVF
jgi:hypothetical protein